MRGKGLLSWRLRCRLRITPAYAGKRRDDIKNISMYEDHPRVCGEKHIHQNQKHLCRGSPPRMRGKVVLSVCQDPDIRITPAYAGKSDFVYCDTDSV